MMQHASKYSLGVFVATDLVQVLFGGLVPSQVWRNPKDTSKVIIRQRRITLDPRDVAYFLRLPGCPVCLHSSEHMNDCILVLIESMHLVVHCGGIVALHYRP